MTNAGVTEFPFAAVRETRLEPKKYRSRDGLRRFCCRRFRLGCNLCTNNTYWISSSTGSHFLKTANAQPARIASSCPTCVHFASELKDIALLPDHTILYGSLHSGGPKTTAENLSKAELLGRFARTQMNRNWSKSFQINSTPFHLLSLLAYYHIKYIAFSPKSKRSLSKGLAQLRIDH